MGFARAQPKAVFLGHRIFRLRWPIGDPDISTLRARAAPPPIASTTARAPVAPVATPPPPPGSIDAVADAGFDRLAPHEGFNIGTELRHVFGLGARRILGHMRKLAMKENTYSVVIPVERMIRA